mgnify:CR=1 FL=1
MPPSPKKCRSPGGTHQASPLACCIGPGGQKLAKACPVAPPPTPPPFGGVKQFNSETMVLVDQTFVYHNPSILPDKSRTRLLKRYQNFK